MGHPDEVGRDAGFVDDGAGGSDDGELPAAAVLHRPLAAVRVPGGDALDDLRPVRVHRGRDREILEPATEHFRRGKTVEDFGAGIEVDDSLVDLGDDDRVGDAVQRSGHQVNWWRRSLRLCRWGRRRRPGQCRQATESVRLCLLRGHPAPQHVIVCRLAPLRQ